MTPRELQKLIRCGENSLVQFKEQFTTQKQIAAEMSAFSNSRGGTILFGVHDKTGEITGLSYRQIQRVSEDLGNAASEHVRPSIYVTTETVEVDGKLVLVASIAEGKSKPYKDLNGTIWVKQASDKRKLTENSEILALFQDSSQYQPETATVAGTSVRDLEMAYVNDYFQKTFGKDKEDFGKPVSQLLKNIGVMGASGELTQVGLLFFGKHPQKFLKTFSIKAVAFFGDNIGETKYRDSRDIEGTIPSMYREAMSFLKANLGHRQGRRGFNTVGELEIPEIVLEELLQNALVHLDLLQPAPIRLLVFSDRIEIINPGTLFGGLTVDDIRLGVSKLRNPAIAGFCSKVLVYRGLGSGIVRTLREGARVDFVNDTSAAQFKAVVWKNGKRPTITDDKRGKQVATDDNPTTTDGKPSINATEAAVLDYLRNNGISPSKDIAGYIGLSVSQTKEYLRRLVAAGLVQSSGANRNKRYQLVKKCVEVLS
ncbi:RNA-binding domain-containing protein [Fibrobacter sp.]|uniref:RNA-binding domain-containing protein n=1 Tax=Fibrobacter sp. TaxID=35828 RepID=UPI00388EF478